MRKSFFFHRPPHQLSSVCVCLKRCHSSEPPTHPSPTLGPIFVGPLTDMCKNKKQKKEFFFNSNYFLKYFCVKARVRDGIFIWNAGTMAGWVYFRLREEQSKNDRVDRTGPQRQSIVCLFCLFFFLFFKLKMLPGFYYITGRLMMMASHTKKINDFFFSFLVLYIVLPPVTYGGGGFISQLHQLCDFVLFF